MEDDLLFVNANEEIAQILSEFERPIHRNVCMGFSKLTKYIGQYIKEERKRFTDTL